MAIMRIMQIPYSYQVDKYRWDLFKGLVKKKDMNCHWVKLSLDLQGTFIMI